MAALARLHEHTTVTKMAAGFRISESATHAYTSVFIVLITGRAPAHELGPR